MATTLAVTVDTTGAYDKFLTALEANIGKAKPGDIRFVLHADEDKELYVPRKGNSKLRYNLFINPVDIEGLRNGPSEVHHSMAMMLEERVNLSGYYVVWENAHRVNLVPAPSGKKQLRKFSNGFAA